MCRFLCRFKITAICHLPSVGDLMQAHVESEDSVKHGLLDNRGCKQGWSDGQLIIRAIIHLPRILSFRRPV